MAEKANIMIGTPAYSHQIHTDYLHSVMGFYQAAINFSVMTIGNESLITRARNSVVAAFEKHPTFTHLLFLDADIHLKADDLQRLIDYDKDVIGAPVPLKSLDADGKRTYNFSPPLSTEGNVAKVKQIGTAVLLLSRKAVMVLIEDAKLSGQQYIANHDLTTRGTNDVHYDIFQVGVVDETYLSEDFWVCHKLKDLGFDIHVDLEAKVRHNGTYTF